MRVLVTGGSGYIGTLVLARLSERADVDEIVNVDLRPPERELPKVRTALRSVTDDLADLAAGCGLALHLAWVLNPLHDAERQRAVNLDGTRRFLQACLGAGVTRVFFMSSITAYGAHPEHDRPLDEAALLRERWHFQYSAEKREAELLCRIFAAENPGRLLQIARPCTVGGPRVSNFIFRSIDRPLTLRLLGHDPRVQLVHEEDTAAAVAAIVASERPGAFNVVADEGFRLSEAYGRLGVHALPVPFGLLWAINRLAWRRRWTRLVEAPPEFLHFLRWPCLGSNRRITEELGFRFRFSAWQTLESYLAARGRGNATPAS